MSRVRGYGVLVALLGGMALGAPRAAADAAPANAAVLERVQALEAELALLKRKLEVQDEATAAKPAAPIVGAGADGFFLRSPDSKYQLRLRGYTHFDGRFFSGAEDVSTTDSFTFRRIRPILDGTLGGFVDFRIMPDFAGSSLVVQDAYANLRFRPEAQLQFGKYKAPFGLERLESATAMWFIERALPTLLVPNRDLGVMFHGVGGEGLVSYQLAYMNGVNDGGSADVDGGDDKDFVARVFVHPFQNTSLELLQGLGVGIASTYGRQDSAPASFRSMGGQTFFQFRSDVRQDGDRVRTSPQAYWFWGPFALLGEYVQSSGDLIRGANRDRVTNAGWQVAAVWVITGENTSWRGVLPASQLDASAGSLGAFELVARYSRLNLDEQIFENDYVDPALYPEDTDEWGVGLNWYLNRWVKLGLNYERLGFSGAGADRDDESVVLTRVQLAY